jgi:hypothetical protein
MPIHAGPRCAPDPVHAGQAIGPAACGRDGPAHRRNLVRGKGRLASSAASSNSRSSSISPSLALRRSLSSSSLVAGRGARLASPATRKASCHPPQGRGRDAQRPRECPQVFTPQQAQHRIVRGAQDHPQKPKCPNVATWDWLEGELGLPAMGQEGMRAVG